MAIPVDFAIELLDLDAEMSEPKTSFSEALAPDFGVWGLATLDHHKIWYFSCSLIVWH